MSRFSNPTSMSIQTSTAMAGLSDAVLQAMAQQPIKARSPEFMKRYQET